LNHLEDHFMIEHEGIIEKIRGNHITVRILQQSACGACHAKGMCTAADTKEKLVDVSDYSGQFHENETGNCGRKRNQQATRPYCGHLFFP